ncbi:cytochrome b/b6 domain-containing protein [Cyanobium sp. Morenito 9A2]|uniref:cytochrome b/b6 domain-containing protein n=1 Tax=Cyanobium sp. Morenito 9A2 TaxID=2823718 RepID=UPI0020CD0CF8|nr:cytochrome b/b6 domain-containing protein [Cyanobium sp. Morenito 9A2]MCP9848530.1 cytochrome B [Cyanobium sp. Morenito 9A2]
MARPYQPSLLRLLHGVTALLVAATWFSGLLVYSRYDGRWGRLNGQFPGEWIDLHGTAGVILLPLALLLGLYAFTLGRRQLSRISNVLPLAALALAIGSGKLMQEDWLRNGDLHHSVYSLHLCAWLLISLSLLGHLAGSLRRGGPALLGSMLSLHLQARDRPQHWPGQLGRWWGKRRER